MAAALSRLTLGARAGIPLLLSHVAPPCEPSRLGLTSTSRSRLDLLDAR